MLISATDGGDLVANYGEVFASVPIRRMLWTTVEICFYTTVLSLVIGYVIAFAVLTPRPCQRALMMVSVVVPLWVSVLVRCFAWIAMPYPNGPLNSGLEAMGLISQPLELLRNALGVVIGMVHYILPFAILPLFAAMPGIDMRVVSAARSLGPHRRRLGGAVFHHGAALGRDAHFGHVQALPVLSGWRILLAAFQGADL